MPYMEMIILKPDSFLQKLFIRKKFKIIDIHKIARISFGNFYLYLISTNIKL